MAGMVTYDGTKNIVYAISGPTRVGQELIDYLALWDSVVVSQNLQNFNCILDISPLDVQNYKLQEDPIDDYWMNGLEGYSVRERGNGKMILVIDPQKGNSLPLIGVLKPDAVCNSVEDAEYFLVHGDGVDRGPSIHGGEL